MHNDMKVSVLDRVALMEESLCLCHAIIVVKMGANQKSTQANKDEVMGLSRLGRGSRPLTSYSK